MLGHAALGLIDFAYKYILKQNMPFSYIYVNIYIYTTHSK